MEAKIIGRKKELAELKEYIASGRSEFIAVYGRRRVGKTFMVRQALDDKFSFYISGMCNAKKKDQLTNFAVALQKYSDSDKLVVQDNWVLAFFELSKYLETLSEGPKTIFIDELPWMDSPKSGFISALENFWNSWAALRNDVKLIVCGSATSWIINNIIKNRGGLHNRLTHQINLRPFTLKETAEYFDAFGFNYSYKQVAEAYMVLGGVPYYLSMFDRSKSLAQNIDRLFFSDSAPLAYEFNDLYNALFKNPAPYISVVTSLATKGIGLTRQELVKAVGVADNGAFSTVLEDLEQCGFIRSYNPFANKAVRADKRTKKATLYQLVDFYTLFYFKFIKENHYYDETFWTTSMNTPVFSVWAGLSFEILCLNHINQIKDALGISGVRTSVCSWRLSAPGGGAQIDLLIDRQDVTINICEMKYSKNEFEISATYEKDLQRKLDVFRETTGTRKALILTLISSDRLVNNSHSGLIQSSLTLSDLFR